MLERIEIIDFVVFIQHPLYESLKHLYNVHPCIFVTLMKRPLYENNGFMGKKRKKNSKNFVVFT